MSITCSGCLRQKAGRDGGPFFIGFGRPRRRCRKGPFHGTGESVLASYELCAVGTSRANQPIDTSPPPPPPPRPQLASFSPLCLSRRYRASTEGHRDGPQSPYWTDASLPPSAAVVMTHVALLSPLQPSRKAGLGERDKQGGFSVVPVGPLRTVTFEEIGGGGERTGFSDENSGVNNIPCSTR